MRHIPDEELHAYLDQALSRSQCVEIESHLAACGSCQAERDAIAALRDQTTALLSTLAPPRRVPPPFASLAERGAERSAARSERMKALAWAASVLLAVGAGWGANSWLERSRVPSIPATSNAAAAVRPAPLAPTAPAPTRLASAPAGPDRPAAVRALPPSHSAPAVEQLPEAPSIRPMSAELSSGKLPSPDLSPLTGPVWRPMGWDRAQSERGDSVARIAGLPVVEVQVAPSQKQGSGPITVVVQRLTSGEVIRTIEGPATDVTRLLASQSGTEHSGPWPTIRDSGISGGDGAMAVRRGDRILAITAPLSNDSLRAMIRRLNAEQR